MSKVKVTNIKSVKIDVIFIQNLTERYIRMTNTAEQHNVMEKILIVN